MAFVPNSQKISERVDLIHKALVSMGTTIAELVAVGAIYTPPVGTVHWIDGVGYQYKGTGSAIPGFPGWVLVSTGGGGSAPPDSTEAVDNVRTGTTYTLALADGGKEISLTNTSGCIVSIPLDATVSFPVGTRIPIWADANGTYTIKALAGVTLNGISAGTPSAAMTVNAAGVRNGVILRKTAINSWTVSGAIAAVS